MAAPVTGVKKVYGKLLKVNDDDAQTDLLLEKRFHFSLIQKSVSICVYNQHKRCNV